MAKAPTSNEEAKQKAADLLTSRHSAPSAQDAPTPTPEEEAQAASEPVTEPESGGRPKEETPPDPVPENAGAKELTLKVTDATDPTKLVSQETVKLEDLQNTSPFIPTGVNDEGAVAMGENIALDSDGMPRSVEESPVEAFLGDVNGDNTPKAPHPRFQTDAGAPDPMKRQPGVQPNTANVMEHEGKTAYVLSAPWFDGIALHPRGTVLYFDEGAQPRGSRRVEGEVPEAQPKNAGPDPENSNV